MPVVAIGVVQQPVCEKQFDAKTKIPRIADISFDLVTEFVKKFLVLVVLGDMVSRKRVVMVVHQLFF
jgi:hypothetical protein